MPAPTPLIPQNTQARTAASRLREAVEAAAAAEQRLNDATLSLLAGSPDLSATGKSPERVILELIAAVFVARRRIDEIRFELVAPDDHRLVPNDEDDVERAHTARLRALLAELTASAPPRLTATCLGLTSVSR
ncbi:hypothetical protein [Methylobacterium nodulans]|uniref:Uncharacterized protein n=1 Tax=Methylobacterium nodulans (strain LMG 21967 / CNCM I-2342 / ORS 2060) TaxID=460265 RepID=B8IAN9_METNO|nr:hypothetical protein [Methylobacterium nodulans]ACL61084.1 hypothetical protein Mnod_6279 [Methylobacterium nodulans ORS 2060]